MSNSSSTGKRPTFYSKIVRNMDPKIIKFGSIFSLLFLLPIWTLFQRFCLPHGPKMVPKKLSFLRPLTLLKCSKQQPDLTFPGPGEGTFLSSLFETPPEHAFYRFWSTCGVHLGTLWNHFFDTFLTTFSDPPFELSWKSVLAMEREARRKLQLCFINVLELADTHQHRCSRAAEITSTPQKKEH